MPEDLLKEAITLCKAGEKHKADLLLRHILRGDPHNESAWLWLADAQPDAGSRLRMLRSFLRANPQSQVARQAVEQFAATLPKKEKPAPAATAQTLVQKAPSAGIDWRLPVYLLSGIVLVGILVLVMAWFARGGQFAPANGLAPTPSLTQAPTTAPALPEATRTPRMLPTAIPTPTSATCGCEQALAYLERSSGRIQALQNDRQRASDAVERLPESKVDFATLSDAGRARYEQQYDDQPPQCLLALHQKIVTYFASWWHAMDAIALGENNNPAAFLASFGEKETEIDSEAQILLEQFQQCAP